MSLGRKRHFFLKTIALVFLSLGFLFGYLAAQLH